MEPSEGSGSGEAAKKVTSGLWADRPTGGSQLDSSLLCLTT